MSGHLIPPINFGMIEEDVYRCGQPNVLNFPFMEKLNLKKVIWLAPDDPTDTFMNFIDDQGIEFLHMGLEVDRFGETSRWMEMSEEAVISSLQHLLDPNNYPLCIMCNRGRHRTGTVSGCLRKIQRWNLTSIFEEYRRYAGPKVRPINEQFIELFDVDLVHIPVNSRPKWLYQELIKN